MLYYQNIIYAHRPWMSRRDTDSQPYLWEKHNPEHARAMCIDAAISIAKLLQIYEARYGLRRISIQAVSITCSAALLLIFAVVISRHEGAGGSNHLRSPTDEASQAMHLGTCFRALDDFGSAWESAKKARDFLNLLQRRWEIQARKLQGSQAAGTSEPGPGLAHDSNNEVIPAKRPRRNQESTEDDEGQGLRQPPQSKGVWPGPTSCLDQDILDGDFDADLGWIFMDGRL